MREARSRRAGPEAAERSARGKAGYAVHGTAAGPGSEHTAVVFLPLPFHAKIETRPPPQVTT